MKTIVHTSLLALAVCLVTGCSSSFYQTGILAPAATGVSPQVNCSVEVVTGTTLQGSAVETVTFGIFKSGPSEFTLPQGAGLAIPSGAESVVAAAWFNALRGTDYDVIINPKVRLTMDKTLFSKSVKAEVVGYPGKFSFD